MTAERFEYLLQLWQQQALSADEWEELRPALNSGEHDTLLDHNIYNVLQCYDRHPLWTPEKESRLLTAIHRQLPFASRTKRLFLIKWWAAAALVGALSIATWLYIQKQPTTISATNIAQSNIAPGGNKATLTLANGSIITLDGAITGNIANENGVTIQKLNNGQLAYNKSAIRNPASEISYNSLTTPRGGQYQVTLPDGTQVWINSASALKYPTAFTGRDRVVELSGEAYFEVAKNSRQPFRVKVNDLEVQVLGTQFNIHAYPDENNVRTTLVAGGVAVSRGASRAVLQPGQQATAHKELNTLVTAQANITKALAWKNGLFIFDDTNLKSILQEVARWYDIEIVNQTGKPLSTEPYGGVISRNKNLTQVLELLERSGNYHFKVEGRRVMVLP